MAGGGGRCGLWAGLVPKETQEQVVKTYREVEEAFPWQIDIDHFEIKGAKAHFEDRTFDEPVQLDVENANVALTDIVTGPGHRWGLAASASLLVSSWSEAYVLGLR